MAERREGGRDRGRDREERDDGMVDKLVHINRVAKVVKGGKRFGFAALVVVGDQKGRVGYGHGKAREVPEAIRKATEAARRGLIRVPLREGRTLHHDVVGRHGAGRVILRADQRDLSGQSVLCLTGLPREDLDDADVALDASDLALDSDEDAVTLLPDSGSDAIEILDSEPLRAEEDPLAGTIDPVDLIQRRAKNARPRDRIAAVVDRAVAIYTGKEFKAALQVWAAAASDPALRELILPLEAKFARAAHRMTVQALGPSDDDQRIHRIAQLTLDLARGLGLADTLSDDSKRRAQVVATYIELVRSALGE